MKQIIYRNSDSSVSYKYYKNDKGQYHGLFISYWDNGNIMAKINIFNNNGYGLESWYYSNCKIEKHTYFL